MKEIKDESNHILAVYGHISDTEEDNVNQYIFPSPVKENLQWGFIQCRIDMTLKRHEHISRPRPRKQKTQEFVQVLQGEVEVSIYNTKREFIEKFRLFQGGFVCFYDGGHELNCIGEFRLLEVKTGPFVCTSADKVRY